MSFATQKELTDLFVFMANERGLKLPYNYFPGRNANDVIDPTATGWVAYIWNPPVALAHIVPSEDDPRVGDFVPRDFTIPDPEADLKPTWDELLAFQIQFEAEQENMMTWIRRADNALANLNRWIEQQRTEHVRALRIPLSVGIIPGHRIESVSNLVVLSQQAAINIFVQIRDEDDQLVTITDRSDLISYITEISSETNRLHNVGAGDLRRLAKLYPAYA